MELARSLLQPSTLSQLGRILPLLLVYSGVSRFSDDIVGRSTGVWTHLVLWLMPKRRGEVADGLMEVAV